METNSSNFSNNRNDSGTAQSRHELLGLASTLPARNRPKRARLSEQRSNPATVTSPFWRRMGRPIAWNPHALALPGRIVSDGVLDAHSARAHLYQDHVEEIYDLWAEDDFQSDFDQVFGSETDLLDFPGLRSEMLAQRLFD